ncbi:MAG: hypothetical protein IJ272_06250 [Clostridia bacterium]|nr:hypothetical protein [Clostridia bacterium]
MHFLENIFSFFRKVFKKDATKMISEPKKEYCNEDKNNFINELRQNVAIKVKGVIEVPVCFGDGLGIQDEIKY